MEDLRGELKETGPERGPGSFLFLTPGDQEDLRGELKAE
jgi:hypothetical protein